MGDRLQAGKPFRYVISHPGQLSLAIPLWVGAMSTSESWDVNRHTARCTSPVSVVWQCRLVSGWGLTKRRSAPLYGLMAREGLLRFLRTQCSVQPLTFWQENISWPLSQDAIAIKIAEDTRIHPHTHTLMHRRTTSTHNLIVTRRTTI